LDAIINYTVYNYSIIYDTLVKENISANHSLVTMNGFGYIFFSPYEEKGIYHPVEVKIYRGRAGVQLDHFRNP
jgi:hypothetical protein